MPRDRRRLSGAGACGHVGCWLCESEPPRQSVIRTTKVLANAVQRVVTLALVAHSTADGDVGRRAGDHLAVLIHVSHGNLDRSVVLGLNETTSGGTLAGPVKVDKLSLFRVSNCVTDRRWYLR